MTVELQMPGGCRHVNGSSLLFFEIGEIGTGIAS